MGKRNKYDYVFRLQCISAVLEGQNSVKGIAKERGVDPSNLRLWLKFYDAYGEAGLKARPQRYYESSFKVSVLKAIEQESLSLREACARFNIASDSVIINWRRAYELGGKSGLNPKSKGRPPTMKQPIKRKKKAPNRPLTREEELLKENEYLRAENELLKKLQALVLNSKKQKP